MSDYEQNTNADAKYIFILFILALIVIIFGVIIYLLSDSVEQASTQDVQTFREEVLAAESANTQVSEETVNELAEEQEEVLAAEEEAEEEEQKEIATIIEERTIKQVPENFDARYYNRRDESDTNLYGAELIQSYFKYIKEENYTKACSLLSKGICSTTSNVASFSYYPRQTENGFDVKRIYKAPLQKDDVTIYCVEYSYKLKADLNPDPITELFQYRVATRPDGLHEITARVCEEKNKGGRIVACPIRTPKKYCIAQ